MARRDKDPKQVGEEKDTNNYNVKSGILASESAQVTSTLFDILAKPGLSARPGRAFRIGRNFNHETNLLQADSSINIPTFMQVKFVPACGIAKTITDPINVAGYSIYKKIQLALRQRSLSYEMPDVMVLLYAVDSLSMLWEFGKRGYAAVSSGSSYNFNFPARLAEACGIDYADWVANRINIENDYVRWSTILENVKIPNVFKFSTMHQDMCGVVYADTQDVKAQYYAFVPQYYYSYENVDEAHGLTISAFDLSEGATTISYQKFKTAVDNMIRYIMNSADFDVITNGLYAAYEGSKIYDFSSTLTTNVPLIYSEVVLESLRNAYVLSLSTNNVQNLVPKDSTKGYLACPDVTLSFQPNNNGRAYLPYHIFNTCKEVVDTTDVANFSRWHVNMTMNTPSTGTSFEVRLESYGTEIITETVILTPINNGPWFTPSDASGTIQTGHVSFDVAYAMNDHNLTTLDYVPVGLMVLMQSFRYHPIVWLNSQIGDIDSIQDSDATHYYMIPVTQWDFNFSLDYTDVETAHSQWVQSVFGMGEGEKTPTTTEESTPTK